MASVVRILDDTVINQIAAGEVVERPASVVKELVENAIDADAAEITIVISQGGRSSIEVIDNGSGMSKDDALLAIERFGTSKIRSSKDLQHIGTLGFRGEALPSIASVSRFQVNTCLQGEKTGVSLRISGGRLLDVNEIEMPAGTRIRVSGLFYNVPARKKFLRSEGTETGLIKSLLSDFALAYPRIRFRLVANGRDAATFAQSSGFSERVRQLRLARGRQVQIDESGSGAFGNYVIRGVLSHPVESVAGSARLRLIVNKRSVRDKMILAAVRDGFGSYLKAGRYPSGVLSLELACDEVDVNVHPQKTEIRFARPSAVFEAISNSIKKALASVSPDSLADRSLPSASVNYPSRESSLYNEGFQQKIFAPRGPAEEQAVFFTGHEDLEDSSQTHQVENSGAAAYAGSRESERSHRESLSSMRYVGQIFKLYLLFEGEELFALVDMHAAHERVMFYKLKKGFTEGGIASQMLLLPETFPLPPSQIDQFEKSISLLQKLGFIYERFGEDSIVLRAVPAVLSKASPRELISDCLSLPTWSNWQTMIDKHLDNVIARLACHGSVRSGRQLEQLEAHALIDSLAEAEASAFCPHGRPVVQYFSQMELEARFGRR